MLNIENIKIPLKEVFLNNSITQGLYVVDMSLNGLEIFKSNVTI